MFTRKQLKELADNVKETEVFSKLNLNNWDPRTVVGMATKVRAAVDELPGLIIKYKKALATNAIAIVVTGANATAFSSVSKKIAGTYTIDANALYRTLAAKLQLVDIKFCSTHIRLIGESLIGIGRDLQEMGLVGDSIPTPEPVGIGIEFDPIANTPVAMTRKSIEASHERFREPANTLARQYLTNVILTEAAADLYDSEILCAVITNPTETQLTDLKNYLFGGKVFVVSTDEDLLGVADVLVTEITKETVIDTLKSAILKLVPSLVKKAKNGASKSKEAKKTTTTTPKRSAGRPKGAKNKKTTTTAAPKRSAGRPKGSKNKKTTLTPTVIKRTVGEVDGINK